MGYTIIDNKTNIPDVSYEQREVAELMLRNLNNYRDYSYRMQSSSNKWTSNKNRPSEAQLWRINLIEQSRIGVKFKDITRTAATKFLERYIQGGYKEERLIEPQTDEERLIMSMPI